MDDKYARTGIFGPEAAPPGPTAEDYRRLTLAVALAHERHAGQVDHCGQPFVGHPLRVMAMAAPDPFGMTVRVVHDLIEDTDTTLAEIAELLGADIAVVVDALTHRKGQETYRQYIERLYRTPAARQPKRDDIRDNSDPRRVIDGVTVDGQSLAEWHEAMVRTRYQPALHYLEHGEWPE